MRLDLEEGRVIGCLIEKQLATPQQYPLTLNALLSACNQSSNRDPVVTFEERPVAEALARLKDAGLVRFVHPSHGRSVTRYAQTIGEWLALDDRRLALVAVLLLRGPQTVGELRARTERMAAFEGPGALEDELQAMGRGPEALVVRLARRPGQKEERWAERLSADEPEVAADPRAGAASAPVPAASADARYGSAADGAVADGAVADGEQLVALAAEVASLRAEVAALRASLEGLRASPEALEGSTPHLEGGTRYPEGGTPCPEGGSPYREAGPSY